ncbi:putative adhesion protein-related protein, partial [Cutibacterium acnes]
MTTHKNTHEQQYRHAPLNGLIIGATIGIARVLVLLIPGLFPNAPSRRAKMDLFPLLFPILGWITGAWE